MSIWRFFLFIFLSHIELYCFGVTVPDNLRLHADSTDKNLSYSHLKLASYLAIPAENDRQKILIFSYWISKYIKYDLNELQKLGRNKIPREVLSNRKAVCQGYSLLFEQLCDNANIPAITIEGYAYGNIIKRITDKVHCRHAWNAVFVDGKWELLDLTWCTNDAKERKFSENPDLKWVFVNPIEFSKTHLPHDPRWQLLKTPKSKEDFWRNKQGDNLEISSQNDLKKLSEQTKTEIELSTIKSQFENDLDKKTYIENLLRLAWSCSNGNYNSQSVLKGIELFNHAHEEIIRIDPLLRKRKYIKMVRSGIYISKKRLEIQQ